MSENQQMSNLIESRHRNEIEQKKIEKETKQINKTPSVHSNLDTSVFECGHHKTIQLQKKTPEQCKERKKNSERM